MQVELNKEPTPIQLKKVRSHNAPSMKFKSKKTVFSPQSAGLGKLISKDPVSPRSTLKEPERFRAIDKFMSNENRSNSNAISNDTQQHGPEVDAINLIEPNLGQIKEVYNATSSKNSRAGLDQEVNKELENEHRIDQQSESNQEVQKSEESLLGDYGDQDENLGQPTNEPAKFILRTAQRPLSKEGQRATKYKKVIFNKRFHKTSKSRTRKQKKIKVSSRPV